MSLLFQNRCKLGGFANLIFRELELLFYTPFGSKKEGVQEKYSIIFIEPYDVKNKLTFRDVIRSL